MDPATVFGRRVAMFFCTWCCGLPHYERNQYLGGLHSQLFKQQLVDDSANNITIRDKTKSIQNPAFCFSLCFTFFWLVILVIFSFKDLKKTTKIGSRDRSFSMWLFTALIQGKGMTASTSLPFVAGRLCEEEWSPAFRYTHLANGPWKKSLNFIFPTKYVIPKSSKG